MAKLYIEVAERLKNGEAAVFHNPATNIVIEILRYPSDITIPSPRKFDSKYSHVLDFGREKVGKAPYQEGYQFNSLEEYYRTMKAHQIDCVYTPSGKDITPLVYSYMSQRDFTMNLISSEHPGAAVQAQITNEYLERLLAASSSIIVFDKNREICFAEADREYAEKNGVHGMALRCLDKMKAHKEKRVFSVQVMDLKSGTKVPELSAPFVYGLVDLEHPMFDRLFDGTRAVNIKSKYKTSNRNEGR